jgi:hypothetical protein
MTTGKSFGSIWLNNGVRSRESLKETLGKADLQRARSLEP